jgi:glycosyltransferase involved in cell wall biosynthesis
VNERPEATVVVPTRDRPRQLERCLRALERQRRDVTGLEVVVVDDGSRDAAAVQAATGQASARLVRLERRGPSAARNAGARAARAPYVCFTDDDCEPAPGWAARLVARLDAGADAVGGPTVNGDPRNRLGAASQFVANTSGDERFAPASNLACRVETLRRHPFDESYGAGGEDREWFARLAAAGCALDFEPGAVVLHFQRLSLGGFWRKHVRYGHGAYRFRRAHRGGRLEPAGFYAGLLQDGFRRGPLLGALVALSQVATAAGFARAAALTRTGARGARSAAPPAAPARSPRTPRRRRRRSRRRRG